MNSLLHFFRTVTIHNKVRSTHKGFLGTQWLDGADTVSSSYSTGAGSGSLMGPYTIDSGGNYMWYLNNGLCGKMSDTFALSVVNCNACQDDSLAVTGIVCDTANPSGYILTIVLYSPGACTYTLGTNFGPISPFSGSLPGLGTYTMTLSYTLLGFPADDTATVEVIFTLPSGVQCVQKDSIKLPSCIWIAERNAHGDSTTSSSDTQAVITTAMLVAPNPASGQVTISFNYGSSSNLNGGNISVYDMMGRGVASFVPQSINGSWNLNTSDWVPGIYIIRMEGNGRALQTQRIVISH